MLIVDSCKHSWLSCRKIKEDPVSLLQLHACVVEAGFCGLKECDPFFYVASPIPSYQCVNVLLVVGCGSVAKRMRI